MITEMELAKHNEQRGVILKALKADFGSKMTSVASLGRALFMVGHSVTPENLQFHLSLLAESGYVKIWRAEDLPTWRSDRQMGVQADKILFARLAPKGLQLIDGVIEADPQVSF